MSAMNTVNFTCKDCGNDNEVTLESSANFMDSRVTLGIITGDIMLTVCKKCGKKYFLDRPFLFNSILDGKFIWYIPKEIEDTSEFYHDGVETVIIRDYAEFAKEVEKIMHLI